MVESWRDFSQPNRFCNVSPVNFECYLMLDGEMKRWKKEEIFWNLMNDYLGNVVVEYIRYEFLNLLNSNELTRFFSNILMNKLE